MHLFGKNLDTETVIIAEIGVNHEGDLETAKKLMRLAHQSGADAAKFQTFTPDKYASSSDPARLERVTGFDLGEAGFRELAAEAKNLSFPIFSTAVSDDVIPFLDELFPVIKIASGDLDFEPVIAAAAKTGKPVILSTGLGNDAEVETAVGWFAKAAGTTNLRDRLILMHCVSAYPTPIEDANVLAMTHIAEKTGLRTGYSDHTIGLEACLAAVALGAPVIEVHFTDCKTGREFRDHALSSDPEDMKQLVEMTSNVRMALGSKQKARQESELANLSAVRKGVVASRDLKAGTILTREDLMFARPATEIPATEISSVIGQTLTVDLEVGNLVRRKDISN